MGNKRFGVTVDGRETLNFTKSGRLDDSFFLKFPFLFLLTGRRGNKGLRVVLTKGVSSTPFGMVSYVMLGFLSFAERSGA